MPLIEPPYNVQREVGQGINGLYSAPRIVQHVQTTATFSGAVDGTAYTVPDGYILYLTELHSMLTAGGTTYVTISVTDSASNVINVLQITYNNVGTNDSIFPNAIQVYAGQKIKTTTGVGADVQVTVIGDLLHL